MAAERDQWRTPGTLTRGPRPGWQRAGLAVAAVTLGVTGAGAFLADTYATQTTCDHISGIGVAGEGYDSVRTGFDRHAGLLLLHSDLRHAVRGLAADERKRQTLAAQDATAVTVRAALAVDDDIEARARVAQASCNLPVVGVLFPGEDVSLTASTTPIAATPATAVGPATTAPSTTGSRTTTPATTPSNARPAAPSGASAAPRSGASAAPRSGASAAPRSGASAAPRSGASAAPRSGAPATSRPGDPAASRPGAPSGDPSGVPSRAPSAGPEDIAEPAPAYAATPAEIAQAQARVAEADALYRRLLVSPVATLAQRDVALYELAAAKTHLADLEDGDPNARHPKLELWGANAYLSAAIADYRTLLTDPSATEEQKTQAVAIVDYWQNRFDTLAAQLTAT
ncbi:hypothetical protein [Paractinoplanes atraurantiacus]|uniref:Uncharacterized protein n=1 Tax=Paractinoplanes atraurantiacus TaxID=1036182 RepID=A0A285IBQ8_9ACTN|nr:hypothetical protein [Actinoplanes atraurantiacus]SNY44486.1 hypothetical protein SAMN05421748_10778 [Actinoplanes atraurantiacus]